MTQTFATSTGQRHVEPLERRFSVLGARAAASCVPEDVRECSEVMTRAARLGQRLTFVGGGTSLDLGDPPRALDLMLGTERLTRVVDYAPDDQVVVAEAGVTLAALQGLAREHKQWLGVDAPHPERATLGGLVAVGAFGPRRVRYGAARDLLLGVTLVRADGAVARSGSRVVKNVAGFDLPKVVCGSLGTLGLIAEVILRLHPLPECSRTLLLSGLDASGVGHVVRELRRAQLEPSSLAALRAGASRFELGMRFEGFEQGVERDLSRALELEACSTANAVPLDTAGEAAFWQRHDSARTEGPLRARVAALPSELPHVDALLAPVLARLEDAAFAWYPSLGVGFASGRAVPGADLGEPLARARAELTRRGGALILERAPEVVRATLDAWGTPTGGLELMRALKHRFDPEGRLNPGRFVGGI